MDVFHLPYKDIKVYYQGISLSRNITKPAVLINLTLLPHETTFTLLSWALWIDPLIPNKVKFQPYEIFFLVNCFAGWRYYTNWIKHFKPTNWKLFGNCFFLQFGYWSPGKIQTPVAPSWAQLNLIEHQESFFYQKYLSSALPSSN